MKGKGKSMDIVILLFFLHTFPGVRSILEELEMERLVNEAFEAKERMISPLESRSVAAKLNHSSLPVILFKQQRTVANPSKFDLPVNLDPEECVHSTFLHIFMPPITFPTADNLKELQPNPPCTWNFFGVEACVPSITCQNFELPDDCEKDYLIIKDGMGGKQKFCGTQGPSNTIASSSLRDLFVTLKSSDTSNIKVNCTVKCTERGIGKLLVDKIRAKKERKCFCGVRARANRIVNGYQGNKGEYPWLVAAVEANTRQPFCGGSIINNKFILTAAHCFKGKFTDYRRVQFLAQAYNLDVTPNSNVLGVKAEAKYYSPDVLAKADKSDDSIRYNIEEVILHPLYVSETNDYDIALVRINGTINIKSKTQTPICLPPPKAYRNTYANKIAIVSGWGLQSTEAAGTAAVMQKLNVTIFSQRECKEFYSHRVNKRMLCAGYREGGRDSCMGDSGGPLVLEAFPKLWMQIGTVSWGEGCAIEENPGVYVRMTEMSQWINHVSNEHEAVWCESPPSLFRRG